jgi:hypothetical protein
MCQQLYSSVNAVDAVMIVGDVFYIVGNVPLIVAVNFVVDNT